jgi:hypothetical protein
MAITKYKAAAVTSEPGVSCNALNQELELTFTSGLTWRPESRKPSTLSMRPAKLAASWLRFPKFVSKTQTTRGLSLTIFRDSRLSLLDVEGYISSVSPDVEKISRKLHGS